MVARYTGAGLGLLSFAVTVVSGLLVGNPVAATLSRSILALFLFCLIGLALGAVARLVIAEHERKRELEIRKEFREDKAPPATQGPENKSTAGEGASIGTQTGSLTTFPTSR